ncbi:MAG: hypothetical protein KDB53_04405 [Planctomycetes bacterium]|nr:hypothetical protein [Planctomycetota bacterium]
MDRYIDWNLIRTHEASGALVRVHYRPLPPNFLSRIAGRHAFHTWFELLDRDGRALALDRPVVWGVYQGRDDRGSHDGRALAKWMVWEYEHDGGLERWAIVGCRGHGFVDVALPRFNALDLALVEDYVYAGRQDHLGPYGYILPNFGRLTPVWSCQRYVADFARRRGGPRRLLTMLRRGFLAGTRQRKREGGCLPWIPE